MQLIEFLNQRQNIEKTRNFNVFQNYSLDELKIVFDHIKSTPLAKSHKPIRINVVGTNGKGSTSHYLACLFSSLGYKVGLYTSPHLLSPLERFQIVEKGIPSLPSVELVNHCFQSYFLSDEKRYQSLSYFEFLTLFTYRFFGEQNTDVEIWEAGLGGRLDATKLVEADYVVLTKIGLDHSEILGNTKEAICQEKLGIIGGQCLALFALDEEVDSLPIPFENRPFAQKTKLHRILTSPKESYLEKNFEYAKEIITIIQPESRGRLVPTTFSEIERPKGRMEVLSNSPPVVFDPSHNPDAILTTTLEFSKSHPKFHLLLGSLPDKDLAGILAVLPDSSLESLCLWEGSGFGKFPPPKDNLRSKTLHLQTEGELVPFFQGRIPVLVLGSFRLYGIVANLIQNTINM